MEIYAMAWGKKGGLSRSCDTMITRGDGDGGGRKEEGGKRDVAQRNQSVRLRGGRR